MAERSLVGDIPYLSHVTEREEPLPIAVSVVGAPGNVTGSCMAW
jgi:hypothetical protein